MRPLKRAKKRW